jgi:hypothetical protein
MSRDKIVKLHPSREPDDVLADMMGRLNSVLVMGFDEHGHLQGEASADMSEAEVIFLLRLMERAVMDSVVSE